MVAFEEKDIKSILLPRNKSRYAVLISEIRGFLLHEERKAKQDDIKDEDCARYFRAKPAENLKDIIYPNNDIHEREQTNDGKEKNKHKLSRTYGKPTNTDVSGGKMRRLMAHRSYQDAIEANLVKSVQVHCDSRRAMT